MTQEEFDRLRTGSLIRHKLGGQAMVIAHELGNSRFIAVRTTHVSNPDEWLLIDPATGQPTEGSA